MVLPLLLVSLPMLVWEGGSGEAGKPAGVTAVPAPASATRLTLPGVRSQAGIAGATGAPWVDANGWLLLRAPGQPYLYADVPTEKLPLAAAEAFAFGGESVYIQPAAPAGVAALASALEFLKTVASGPSRPWVNIAVVDDGTAEVGEVMNLFARRNLLFATVPKPVGGYDLTVEVGSNRHPREAAKNPSAFAQQVRYELTDDRRLLRLYGSQVVLGRLAAEGQRVRLHLVNYGPRPVEGLRVRVRGAFRPVKSSAMGQPGLALADAAEEKDALEFTVPSLVTYAVVDLERVVH